MNGRGFLLQTELREGNVFIRVCPSVRTDTYENITFPQLRWWSVRIRHLDVFEEKYWIQCKNVRQIATCRFHIVPFVSLFI